MPVVAFPRSAAALAAADLPSRDLNDLPDSDQRFPDGGQYRIEIPSVEGPDAFDRVLQEATARNVPIHRISQGSGVWMQTDAELDRLSAAGRSHVTEVVLFTGPRAGWDTGVQARSGGGAVATGALRGADQLAYAIEDVLRAADHGISGALVADLGQLMILGRMKSAGDLPADFTLKVSISLPVANPATARVLEDLGTTSLNLPVDLSMPAIAAIRAAVDLPVDVYLEAADDFGGTVRHYEVADLVRVAAPVYLKYTVRNAANTYPSGAHLQPTVLALAAERVRRAELGLSLLHRYYPAARPSPTGGYPLPTISVTAAPISASTVTALTGARS